MNKYSFIIPCYNCATFIEQNILKLENKLKKLKIKYELILINDGSSDKTLKIINHISLKNKLIKIIKNKKNTGKSYSCIKGIKRSRYRNIILIDCDLPYFSSLKDIFYELKKGNELVIVNRKLKESKLIKRKINIYQILRYFIGAAMAYINLKLLKLEILGGDTQAGLKGFKKIKDFNKLKFISKKFFFDLELILVYSKRKLKIQSIKTNYSINSRSSIKILNFSKNLEILKELYWVINKYRKY
tara:strand:+ start:570 stop:1301 length:732 start_codon:yes stop_codon:yes gene_type:complete